MEKVIRFLDKAEGRDKLLKMIQYMGRFLKAVFSNKYSFRFMNLSYASRLARQVFRLGKSILEINHIRKLLKKEYIDSFTRFLDILKSASMCTR